MSEESLPKVEEYILASGNGSFAFGYANSGGDMATINCSVSDLYQDYASAQNAMLQQAQLQANTAAHYPGQAIAVNGSSLGSLGVGLLGGWTNTTGTSATISPNYQHQQYAMGMNVDLGPAVKKVMKFSPAVKKVMKFMRLGREVNNNGYDKEPLDYLRIKVAEWLGR